MVVLLMLVIEHSCYITDKAARDKVETAIENLKLDEESQDDVPLYEIQAFNCSGSIVSNAESSKWAHVKEIFSSYASLPDDPKQADLLQKRERVKYRCDFNAVLSIE
jgi:hypothetical protein